mmetsp:Transcript_69354/g.120172  ORF Transcript_69354/g.120172 Transcript_69354/m.120172 type:complete len:82 (+) Transcript_69354:261-506(+)
MDPDQQMRLLQSVTWQCPIPLDAEIKAGPRDVFLPFANFRPSLFGQKLTGLALDHRVVNHIGLNVGIFDMDGQRDSRYGDG